MDGEISVIQVEIPRAIYERQMMNLVEALLAIDEKVFERESHGEDPRDGSKPNPKEAA